ncbi:hypothetical protein MNEG_7872 [Monoraphidium neglectum]|uniref:Uncharacterized protein n=1 Tax=Monoraphidium neglectum TaxID=145388 RepID=A0A0D2KXW4_9CHLO|nr:hypothetical protein MNEG_7872 [Monoraphidium neglectum]KIZ00089.1 hypothetical protein MNEG_7872 [Monoraphidium neglectum]|eukprot:XP_013899108.1 hypothetical protein MNEG_7872 [Monoraphidium neglectum]
MSIRTQVPIKASALGDALSFSAATAPFSASAWAPQLHGPRLPLSLPSAGANPLRRATAVWWQQHQQRPQGTSDDGLLRAAGLAL